MKSYKYFLFSLLILLTVGCNSDDPIPVNNNNNDTVPNVTNPITGRVWMDRNLGAIRVATSSIDDFSYGHLYQWGRSNDGHEVRTSGISDTLSNINAPESGDFIFTSQSPHDWLSPQNDNLWQGINGVNNPCPEGYRIPTQAEWDEERAS